MLMPSLAIAIQMNLADPPASKVALSGSVIMSHMNRAGEAVKSKVPNNKGSKH
jgi:hypothetical protein